MITIVGLLRFSRLPAFSFLFIVITSCGTLDSKKRTPADSQILIEEPQTPQAFLENYHSLKRTTAYRQNIWLAWNHGQDSSQIALCVDLRNQVYLVVRGTPDLRSKAKLPEYYQNLSVSVPTLQAKMDPDAFVLRDGNPPIIAIFQVPEDATESFGANAINHVLGRHVSPKSLTFQAD